MDVPHSDLQRRLGPTQVAMMGLGGSLGTGLFLGSGDVLRLTGSGAVLSYALTAALAVVVMYAMGEVTAAHPELGGFGAVAHDYLGPLGGFVARWNIVAASCIGVGAEVVAAATYLQYWWPDIPLAWGALGVSVLIAAANFLAVGIYGRLGAAMTSIKIAVIAVFILVSAAVVFNRGGGTSVSHATGDLLPRGSLGFFQGATVAVFSFGGIEASSVAATESRDAARTIAKAFRILAVTLVVADVCCLAGIVALFPQHQTVTGGRQSASPFVRVFSMLNIPAAGSLMNAVLIIASISAALGLMYAASRMLYSLSGDQLAPTWLHHTNQRAVPWRAVAASSLGMALAVALAVFRPNDAFRALAGMLVFGVVITWTMTLLTHLAQRHLSDARPLIRLPFSPAIDIVVLLTLWGFAVQLWWIPGFRNALLAGVPYLFVLLVGGWLATRPARLERLDRQLHVRASLGVDAYGVVSHGSTELELGDE